MEESSSVLLLKHVEISPRNRVLCQLKRWYSWWWMSSIQAGVTGKMNVVVKALSMLFVHVDCPLIVVVVVIVGACSSLQPSPGNARRPQSWLFPMAACQLVCRLQWFLSISLTSSPQSIRKVYFFLSLHLWLYLWSSVNNHLDSLFICNYYLQSFHQK